MSFSEATDRMRAAIAAEDLDALKAALDARAEALALGDVPSLETLEAGERALLDLTELKQRLALESSRLGQIQSALAEAHPTPQVDYQG